MYVVELNTKIQPEFIVDLYVRIYVKSNSINVTCYWKPNFNTIRIKPKRIKFTRKFPKKKRKKVHLLSQTRQKKEHIER